MDWEGERRRDREIYLGERRGRDRERKREKERERERGREREHTTPCRTPGR